MQNKKIIILIVLGIAGIISLFYGMSSPPKTKRNIIPEQVNAFNESTVTTEKGMARLTRNIKRTKYTSWLIDPFSPTSLPIRGYGWLTLGGIMWNEENPTAIINDNIVKIGDEVGKNKVINIEQDRVILNDGNGNFEIIMGE